MLPAEPTEGDPLATFLLLDRVRYGLRDLGIEPKNPAHIERNGRRSLSIHFTDEGDTGMQLRAFLESFRGLMGYTIRISAPMTLRRRISGWIRSLCSQEKV